MRLRFILLICAVAILMPLLASGGRVAETGDNLESTGIDNRQVEQQGNQIARNDASTASTFEWNVDPIEFAGRTRLDLNPIRVWWHEVRMGSANDRVPGPTDYMLKAYLELTEADLQTLISQLVDEPRRMLTETADWWPTPLKALGDEVKINYYDARQYTRQPYFDGALSHIVDTQFIIVEFYTR